jgi:uncharacterized protein
VSSLADRLRGLLGPQGGPKGPPLRDDSTHDCTDERRGGPSGPPDAAEILGGEWRESGGRKFLVVERKYSPGYRHGHVAIADCLPPWPHLQLLGFAGSDRTWASESAGSKRTRPPQSGCRIERLLFLDLETTGLAGGAGTYAFLVGCGWFEPLSASTSQAVCFRTRQLFLSDFSAERALLEAVGELAADLDCIVTYNGKTFDLPLLETRFSLQRMATPFADVPHVDMLHPARRMWRADEVECRLTYLEQVLCGHEREGDVPGFEIPSRYFRYVRSGDVHPLEAVFEHNRLDLVSLAMLTARAVQLLDEGPSAAVTAREALGMGRLYERAGLLDAALKSFARAAGAGLPAGASSPTRAEALRAYAILLRRLRRYEEAAHAWRDLLAMAQCPPAYAREANEALAVHHEHRAHNLEVARTFALQSLRLHATPTRREALEHRLARLDRKLSCVAALPSAMAPLFPAP